MKKANCLVTGGAGFIGSHIVDRLLEEGCKVTVVDDFSTGKERNLLQHKNNPNLEVYNKSICDKDTESLFRDISFVFHVAAIPRAGYSIEYPEKTNHVNVNGTLNVLEMCRKADVKKVIYSASSSVYGNQDKLPLVETMNPNPMSPYASQKLMGEYYCRLYNRVYGIKTISLRYFNVYGTRQDPHERYACLIPKSINFVLQGKSPEVYGDGEQTRDFTYVKDIVEANLLAAVTDNEKSFGHVFNIGSANNLSVNHIVKTIIGNRNIKPKYKPSVIEPRDTLADISKAKAILNWAPKYSFEEEIKEMIGHFENE